MLEDSIGMSSQGRHLEQNPFASLGVKRDLEEGLPR